MRRIAIMLFFTAVIMAGLAAAGIWQMNRFMGSEVNLPEQGTVFEIPAGSSFAAVTRKLVDNGIIENDFWFRLYARWSGEAGGIHAGEYTIRQGATPKSLLEQFTSGIVRLYSFTIVEGWNHRDLLQAMHSHEAIDGTMTEEDWPALLESLGAQVANPEGLFLPETYRFPRDTSDREILAQAYRQMQDVVEQEWGARHRFRGFPGRVSGSTARPVRPAPRRSSRRGSAGGPPARPRALRGRPGPRSGPRCRRRPQPDPKPGRTSIVRP